MKKILNVGIGGVPFVLEEDAYARLDTYMGHFRGKLGVGGFEVMEDLEQRIAELFSANLGTGQVVTLEIVEKVISQLGMPDGSPESDSRSQEANGDNVYAPHKLYRDIDGKAIGGVAAGLAAYFSIDPVLVRLIFVAVCLLGGSGLLIYIIFWLVTPAANTPAEKCELRGIPATAENMSKFSNYGK